MKVLLLHLPAGSDLRAGDRAESLGLGYIAAVLRRDGHEVEVFDAQLKMLDVRSTITEVCGQEFDCLGVTAMHQDRDVLISVIQGIRKQKNDAIILAGGYFPTLDTARFFSQCPEVDIVVRGEGETVASDVFGRIGRGEDWAEAPGIAYVRDGETIMNPLPELISDLDSLPFPARDALGQGVSSEWASVASGRGCYNSCSFCSVNSFYRLSGGHAPRFRDPVKVVDEIESIMASHDIRKFTFIDDDFIGPGKSRERAVRIAEEIIARKLGVELSCECRADEVDEDILKLLKEAGVSGIFLGIESGVQRQLDTYNKRITVEQNKRAIELVRKLGFKMQPGFIPFDPYLTFDELQENMQFARDVNLWEGKAGPTPVKVVLFPGVPLIDKVREDGLLVDNGKDFDYTFQDPSIAAIWKGFNAIAKMSGAVGRLKQRLSGKKAI